MWECWTKTTLPKAVDLEVGKRETLAQIDAVFVWVQPHGRSDKPSCTPLLFAYLRVNTNTPGFQIFKIFSFRS
jgi:hypothetical protein